ncbi:MAG: RNA-directed DNA polymerase [Phenylobacterium sp.]|jgi:RNA-directed DNA polymerase
MRKYYSLYGQLLSLQSLYDAYKHVKSNNGAPGIDGETVEIFGENLRVELPRLLLELKDKTYRASAVKRVTIPKDGGGERLLGIPTVRDRIVQQAVRNILEPIFDPHFHPSSYGYRKGRSCHHAITKASTFIRRYHRQWVVDMDLSKCFDTLDHDLIISQFRQRVTDGSILGLMRQFLESGIMIGVEFKVTDIGSPQGGVISPLIANVYLDNFDQWMKDRGHRMIRYADDILILCKSKGASENALKMAKAYLEGDLKLTVNAEKTHIAHSDEGIKYLGVMIYTEKTRIQEEKLRAFKEKVKKMTRRNHGMNLEGIIKELNPVIRGFANYFRIAHCKSWFKSLMGWIRRRLRCIQMTKWKVPKKLHRRLKQLGYRGPFEYIKMRSWRNSACSYASMAIPNKWLHGEMKLVDITKIQDGISVSVIGG